MEYAMRKGHPNRPGDKLDSIKAIVFHYTNNSRPEADAIANARYFGRDYEVRGNKPYEWGYKNEWGSLIRVSSNVEFAYGSTQYICDENRILEVMPLDEVAWAVGDRPLSYDNGYKGQTELAYKLFNNRQNYETVNIEICNNGDWNKAVNNAVICAKSIIAKLGIEIDLDYSKEPDPDKKPASVILLRHYDLTRKLCPKPMITDGKWPIFLKRFEKKSWRDYLGHRNILVY